MLLYFIRVSFIRDFYMFTLTNIVEKLNFFDISCDIDKVADIIKKLRLEPIFEDEQGQIYYDDDTYETIKSELTPLYSEHEAIEGQIVNKIEEGKSEEHCESEAQTEAKTTEQTALTVDNTGKSIEVIAKNISHLITQDLAEYIKKNHSAEEAFKAGVFKRDNEILSKKLQDTINDNKRLIEKLRQLEYEIHKFHPVFGNIYVKSK